MTWWNELLILWSMVSCWPMFKNTSKLKRLYSAFKLQCKQNVTEPIFTRWLCNDWFVSWSKSITKYIFSMLNIIGVWSFKDAELGCSLLYKMEIWYTNTYLYSGDNIFALNFIPLILTYQQTANTAQHCFRACSAWGLFISNSADISKLACHLGKFCLQICKNQFIYCLKPCKKCDHISKTICV